jgi:hypothetical protein
MADLFINNSLLGREGATQALTGKRSDAAAQKYAARVSFF